MLARRQVRLAVMGALVAGASGAACRCGERPETERASTEASVPHRAGGPAPTARPEGRSARPGGRGAEALGAPPPEGAFDPGASGAGEGGAPATAPEPAAGPLAREPVPERATLDVTPPTPPADLTASPLTDRKVELRWGEASDAVGVTAYEVLREGQVVFAGPGRAAVDTVLQPGRTYCYTVRALDAAGNASAPGDSACATMPDLTPPSVPEDVVAVAVSDTQVALRWSAASDDVGTVSYEVVRDERVVAAGAGTEATESGLRAGTRYCFAVRARDATGNRSPASRSACLTTPDVTPPTAPLRPSARALSEKAVEIRWEAASDDVAVVDYEVVREGMVRRRATATSAVEEGLRAATRYCWEVRARDAAGNRSDGSGPACTTTPDTTPPTPPKRLVAAAAGETRIDVRWQAASDDVGVAGYELSRDGQPIARGEALRARDAGLRAFGEHCYVVRAFDAAQNRSAPAGPVCARTRDETPPAPPGNVVASVAGADRIEVRWEAATDNGEVAAYRVRREGTAIASVAGLFASEGPLRPGFTYCYVVTAVDGAGNRSPDAAPACATIPDVTPPTPPSDPEARATSETEIALRWKASADDNRVEGYEVVAAGGAVAARAPGPAAVAAGLRAGAEHCFTVRARDPAGNVSPESARVCATTPDRTPPQVPPGVSASPASDTEVRLGWKPSRDNVGVAGYEVRRDGALLRVQAGTALADPGLRPAVRYCYEVRAFDAAGNVSEPGPACATTPDLRPPTAPARIDAAPAGGKIAVGWSAAMDDVGVAVYEVLRAGSVVARVSDTSFVESGLEARRWCYTVRALDAAGNRSPETAPACATAPDVMPPSPPSRLRAPKVAETRAELRWIDSTDNVGVVGYEVLRGGAVVITSADPSARDASLAPAREYCWTVRAFDAAGNRSMESDRLCLRTPDETPPALGGELVAAAEVEDAVDLRWARATDNVGVTGYDVLRDGALVASVEDLRLRDGGRRAGARHCYAVRARDAAGHASKPITACLTLPDLTPPTLPSDLEAAPTDTEVALRWTEASDNVGVSAYEVLRGGSVVARAPGAVAVETRLAPRTEHCYRVRALDAAGNRSAAAGPVCATTLDPRQPPAPRNVVAALSGEAVRIAWSASPRRSVVYRVYAGSASMGATRYLAFEVKLGGMRERCFRVTAVDEEGRESPRSKEACLAVVEPASALK